MFKKTWMRVLIGATAVVVLALGGLWAFMPTSQVAFAQNVVEDVTEDGLQAILQRGGRGDRGRGNFEGRGGRGGRHGGQFGQRGGRGGGYISQPELMANALDLTPEELREAHQTAMELMIAQAVEDGHLTQEQADQIGQRGNGPDGNGQGNGGERPELSRRQLREILSQYERETFFAAALDMSVEELEAARDGAIQKAADDGLITQAQANDMMLHKMVRDAMKEARTQAIQQAVEDGLITQAQADNMLEDNHDGFGPGGFEGRGGRRGGHGPRSGGPRGGNGPQQPGNGEGNSNSFFPNQDNTIAPGSDI